MKNLKLTQFESNLQPDRVYEREVLSTRDNEKDGFNVEYHSQTARTKYQRNKSQGRFREVIYCICYALQINFH